jgi:spore cortex formation protein SpoVR/YcgB (stage V sporulation)
MQGIGNIYKSEKEIQERKDEIKKREENRKSPKETKKDLIKFLKKKSK